MGQNTDVNYESHADTSGDNIAYRTLPAGDILSAYTEWSDTLKFSNAKNCVVDHCTIYGGTEDCIDINRFCTDITIQNTELHPAGDQAMTIKGGSTKITLENVTIFGSGTVCEIDLGNFTEVTDVPSTNITLNNVVREDGQPVRVRVLNAEMPTVIGGNVYAYKPWYVKVGLFKVWWWLRNHGVLRS